MMVVITHDGWKPSGKKSTVHFFKDQNSLCNQTQPLNGNKTFPVGDDYSVRFCKKCKIVLNTYSDLKKLIKEIEGLDFLLFREKSSIFDS